LIGPPPESWEVVPERVRVAQLRSGIWHFRLPVARPEVRQVNAYGVEQRDGLTLIDCGVGGDASCWVALVAALEMAGFAPTDVRALVATHAHPDHMGLATPLIEASGCRFYLHPNHGHLYNAFRNPGEVGAARHDRARREGVPEGELDHYGDVSEEAEGIAGAPEPDEPLVEGVRLSSGAGTLEVIETPGHAPSHVALYEPCQRILFSADLVYDWFGPYFDYGLMSGRLCQVTGRRSRISDRRSR
jgi:glyoxylase-like metal-dependent hydrolase (beta-lactamase superfamily II)